MTLSDPRTHSAASDLDELQTHIRVPNPTKMGPTGPSHAADEIKSSGLFEKRIKCWIQMVQQQRCFCDDK